MTIRTVFCLMVLALLTVTVAGCGAPDRSAEATQLEATLRSVPGVESASVSYINGFDSGYTVSVDVDMSGADDRQIVSMVRRMNTVMGRDFDDYDTPVSILVGGNVTIESEGQITPDVAVADLALARVARNGVNDGGVTISRPNGVLRVGIGGADDLARAAGPLAAAIGPMPAKIEVVAANDSSQPRWSIVTPVSEAQLQQAATDIGGLATSVASVSVQGGMITELWVDAGTETEAYSTLSTVIRSIGAGRSRPLRLNWKLAPTVGNERGANGLVTVGACDYPKTVGEREPDTYFESAALALEQRVRTAYDTCPN